VDKQQKMEVGQLDAVMKGHNFQPAQGDAGKRPKCRSTKQGFSPR
jgi:hypothetical protein